MEWKTYVEREKEKFLWRVILSYAVELDREGGIDPTTLEPLDPKCVVSIPL